MKTGFVEKRQLNNEVVNSRETISQRLSEINPLRSKKFKKLISTLAVGLALFGSNGKASQEEISRALAQSKVEEVTDEIVQRGEGIVEWVSEFIKSNTNIAFAPGIEPEVTERELDSKTETNSVLDKDINLISQVITLNSTSASTATATPAPYGAEPAEYYRTELKETLNVSLENPFNYEQANTIFKDSGLTVYDLIVSEITQREGTPISDFSDPNVPTFAMFPEKTMRWTPLIEKLNKKYNSKERFDYTNNGNTEFLGLIFVESYGEDETTANSAGAISPAQVTFYPIDYLAPGNTYSEKFSFASVPENGIEIGYQWFLMDKKNNLKRFEEKGIKDPVTQRAINFMTYNGGSTYSFIIAQGGVDSIRHLTDTIQMRKYALMNGNIMNTYELFLQANKKGYKVTYQDYLKEDNDLEMFQSDFLNQILEEAYQKKRLTNGSFESMTKVLKETIASYEGKEVSLQSIKKTDTEETEGTLNDANLPPAIRAVTLFYNR